MRKILMMTAFSMLLAGGSCQMQAANSPLFCDVEQVRRFDRAELEARKPFRRNLEADLVTNQTGEKHCGWTP